jgi:hypothetical protein
VRLWLPVGPNRPALFLRTAVPVRRDVRRLYRKGLSALKFRGIAAHASAVAAIAAITMAPPAGMVSPSASRVDTFRQYAATRQQTRRKAYR